MSVPKPTPEQPTRAICGVVAGRCVCHKDSGHVEAGDDVHECDQSRCTGAWATVDGEFMIVRLPFQVGETL